MGAINFSKGNYGNTIIMDELDYDYEDFYENNLEIYDCFKDDVDTINSKISQNLSGYDDFLDVNNPMYLIVDLGYYNGFEAYIDSDTNIKRDDYKTDDDYKKAIIDEYVEDADKYCREKYVDDKFTDQDFDKLLDEYRQDLNNAFNQMDYELVKLGQDYGMAILDENGWVTKTHKITDKDVEIAKAKLDNQKTKEKSKDIDDDWER